MVGHRSAPTLAAAALVHTLHRWAAAGLSCEQPPLLGGGVSVERRDKDIVPHPERGHREKSRRGYSAPLARHVVAESFLSGYSARSTLVVCNRLSASPYHSLGGERRP